ncbi:hypothetical protein Y032_0234g3134 [Ancylostoma ceylanicum]|uniref:Uncharacterized protein n=1 Tax=Ancylostoma ceylanicum TaxID=53326 RepID=A0A016SFZ3_9BILA|nr:hypothetical protein Y032_0234g3134 [Ancylostoma ceylanicum]
MHVAVLLALALFTVATAHDPGSDFIRSGCNRSCNHALLRVVKNAKRRLAPKRLERCKMEYCEWKCENIKSRTWISIDHECSDICRNLKLSKESRQLRKFREDMLSGSFCEKNILD